MTTAGQGHVTEREQLIADRNALQKKTLIYASEAHRIGKLLQQALGKLDARDERIKDLTEQISELRSKLPALRLGLFAWMGLTLLSALAWLLRWGF